MHHFLQSIVMGDLAKSTKSRTFEVGGNKIIRLTLMILLRCSGGCISVPGWLLEDNLEPAGLRKTIHSAPELPGDYFEALCSALFIPFYSSAMQDLFLRSYNCRTLFTTAGKYCRIFFFDAACALHIVPGSLLQSYGGSFASMLWRISLSIIMDLSQKRI